MAKVKAQSQVKKKKKIWVQINAPKFFGNKKIGETTVFFAENAIGKRIELNLMTLTGEMKKQNINMKFVIDSVNGNIASTKIHSYSIVPSFIKRLVRRKRDKIDYSSVYVTKDNVKIRIKPLIITSSKTRGSTLTAIEKLSSQLITAEVKKLTFDSFVDQVLSFKFQMNLKNNLKKIHPLKSCDIRQFILESKQDSNAFISVEDETVTEISDEKVEEKQENKETENKKVKKSKKIEVDEDLDDESDDSSEKESDDVDDESDDSSEEESDDVDDESTKVKN
jgi:small subunit ribosomal protein S3Ae